MPGACRPPARPGDVCPQAQRPLPPGPPLSTWGRTGSSREQRGQRGSMRSRRKPLSSPCGDRVLQGFRVGFRDTDAFGGLAAPGVSGTLGPVGGGWHSHSSVRSPHSPTPQVMDRTWLALARASQTPASSPPPMGAPQCLARGGPLPAEVALDAGRTTTCKGSTPTDASRPEPRERRRDSETQDSKLVNS